MKDLSQYKRFADELKELCKKHGIYILGTCSSEGIYGEITLGEYGNKDSCKWNNAEDNVRFNVNINKYGEVTLTR